MKDLHAILVLQCYESVKILRLAALAQDDIHVKGVGGVGDE